MDAQDQDAARKEEMVLAKANRAQSLDAVELHADKIVEYIYLGSEDSAADLEALRYHGIEHVVVPARTSTPRVRFEGEVNYLVWDVYDVPGYPIIWCFDAFTDYLIRAVERKQPVLVHCANGVSRSAAVVCAYLMKTGYAPPNESPRAQVDTCFGMIRKKRPRVSERKFREQLELYARLHYSLQPYNALVSSKNSGSLNELNPDLVAELKKFSIKGKANMRDAFMGKAQTLWPKNA